jgi:nucleoside-diphosphate-sugar epimerase
MTDLNDLCSRFGAELAWGRVFNLYGPGEHPDRLVAASIRAMLAGQPANCTHGDQLRDYLYCVDAAEAFVALLMCNTLGAVNIASGTAIRIRDLIEAAADAIGRRDLVRLGALPAPKDDPAVLLADVKRLNGEVRWRPRVPLAEGIRQSVRFWHSAGDAYSSA